MGKARYYCAAALAAFCVSTGVAQETLSLDKAIAMARNRNGNFRSAVISAAASKSNVKRALAAFLPSLTPTYQYQTSRNEVNSNVISPTSDGSRLDLAASYRLADTGQRQFNLAGAKNSTLSSIYNSQQNLRQILFSVQQQYYEALLQQELLKISTSQVNRTKEILAQTELQVKVGKSAEKDILQARADYMNAQVDLISAQNSVKNSQATLRSTIGWPIGDQFPELERVNLSPIEEDPGELKSVIESGLKARPDLMAVRRSVDAQRYTYLGSQTEAGVTFAVDANYSRQITPDTIDGRRLTLTVSYPLFDGDFARERARQDKLNWEASQFALVQREREASAEIEIAYSDYTQGQLRLKASQLALDAAKQNYDAASESQRLGGSDIIEVLTAQVSLVTAENNYSRALFDLYTVSVKLKLVTGKQLPGEIQIMESK